MTLLHNTSVPASASTSCPDPSLTNSSATHSTYHHALASQVLHNLQYQHDWTSLRIHTHGPSDPALLLPRPLLSGLPPQRVYVHPDEQAELLTLGIREQDVAGEREWVLPAHLKEKWSLRRFAEVFDAVGKVPPDLDDQDGGTETGGEAKRVEGKGGVGNRRGGKRVLLATVADDSTVVYYIVHDGIVKPRQN